MASRSNLPTSDTSNNKILNTNSELGYEFTDNDNENDNDLKDWEVVVGLSVDCDKDEEKKSVCVGKRNDEICWGFFMDQNRRKHMEDRIVTFPGFMSIKCDGFGGCTAPHCGFASEKSQVHYFAVFDGHGGSQVSDYCADSLHKAVKKAWRSGGSTNEEWNIKWQSALLQAYKKVDKACRKKPSGSTAVVVLISSCQIIAANCGDSRAILCRGSHTVPLTQDHKPDREDEEERITKSGGYVVQDPCGVMRVDGVLAMSRSIGDNSLKPYVSAVPELTFTTRTEEDECLIIASDGLWDTMSTELVGSMACQLLQREREIDRIIESPTQYVAEHLFREACSRSSRDNFSVIVIDLKQ